jgi:hypothetical protein
MKLSALLAPVVGIFVLATFVFAQPRPAAAPQEAAVTAAFKLLEQSCARPMPTSGFACTTGKLRLK